MATEHGLSRIRCRACQTTSGHHRPGCTRLNGGAPKSDLHWAIPRALEVPPDQLQLRLNFYSQAVQMEVFEDERVVTKMVSALDVAHALASQLSVSTGILPPDTLWWSNTREGPLVALWREPQVTRVALQEEFDKPPERLAIPMPGLIFLCRPGQPPWVYAAKKRPQSEKDEVFRAPAYNIFADGRSCPGSHRYPLEVEAIPGSFFMAFFSRTGDHYDRSRKFPKDMKALWRSLDGRRTYPLRDLMSFGTVKNLMEVR